MIITRLIGGLGNQMFQYAAARRFAHHHNTDLFLDVTGFASYALRKYELDIFRIHAKIASPDLLKHVPFSRKDVIRLRIWKLFSSEPIIQYVKEKSFDFYEEKLTLPDNVYLDGYWQSEKYFTEIADILRKEFSFVTPPSAINQDLLEEMGRCNSVSMHVRRGDYVSNSVAKEILGVLGIDYYIGALNLLEEKVKDPKIFVFSDDIPWAKANLKTNLPLHFIDYNSVEKDYEDLRLMSNCQHHIIANSSFSWWGAWLGSNSEKIIIAPKKWFNQSNMDTRDLIPDSWIKIYIERPQ
jgi:hypothetical protein